jgi:hypothetical protein
MKQKLSFLSGLDISEKALLSLGIVLVLGISVSAFVSSENQNDNSESLEVAWPD